MEQIQKKEGKKEVKELLLIVFILLFVFLFISNYTKIFEFSSTTIIDAASIFDIFAVSDTTTVSITIQGDTTPPDVFLDSPENKSYANADVIGLNFTITDSQNSVDTIYYNLDNGNNVTVTENTTITDSVTVGSHTLFIFANDTQGNLNDSISVAFERLAAAAPPAPSGGGGGGGGGTTGRVIERKAELFVDKLIKIQIKKGDSLIKLIKIKNMGNIPLDVSLERQEELKEILDFKESKFFLVPLQEKYIEMITNAGPGIVPGVYIGEIYAVYESISEKIQVIIEIESIRVLFDVALDIPLDYKNVLPGNEILLQATVFDISGLRSDINLEWLIKDSKGNTILKDIEVVRVENQASFSKRFLIPADLPLGEYVATAIARYRDSVGTASSRFSVVREEEAMLAIPNIFYYIGSGILFILIALFSLYAIQQRRLKNIEKAQIARLKAIEKAEPPETEEEKITLKKKLENELRLLEKAYNSGYITKKTYKKVKSKIENELKLLALSKLIKYTV